ncbi:MAG: primosomal protein N' [Candidatus Gracilibacteria bacterium]|nr:primosomal protein N' [Candidatus Gracilibacteria bacterium]
MIWKSKIKLKYEQNVSLNNSELQTPNSKLPTKKQQEIIEYLKENEKTQLPILKKQFSASSLATLKKNGIISIKEGDLINPDASHISKPHHNKPLTKEQQSVLKTIQSAQKNTAPSPNSQFQTPQFLLHGITGSGKTEIYLQLIKKAVEKDQQCILLVPEIALTTQTIQYFSEHFPGQISILHSNLSEGQRVQAWHRIHQEKTKLILGSRSALFTPWKKLGLIIIDEEHEWTYKQESAPRYHARTVAEYISQMKRKNTALGAPTLLLGSATPSLESYFKTQKTKTEENLQTSNSELRTSHSKLLSLTHRANNTALPPVHIIDMRDEFKKKNFNILSEDLHKAIQDRIEKKEQTVLFLNKRGSSSSITCRDCGFTPKCTNCDICLTYHKFLRDFQDGGLVCHYCGNFQKNFITCPDCKSSAIRHIGTGTQKAEAQLQELFPKARILRADKDTMGSKFAFETIYNKMKNNEADILLGTQMIAKGLDLPNVTLTGILIADIGLHIPDFRASERVFQLLTQVAGRSGRHKPGEVIIQTYQPFHKALQFAKNHDYLGFYAHEIQQRELFNYPPYSKTIKLIFADENPKIAAEESLRIFNKLNEQTHRPLTLDFSQPLKVPTVPEVPNIPTISLSPHYIPRLHNKYIWNISIQSNSPKDVISSLKLGKGWKIDVDPR